VPGCLSGLLLPIGWDAQVAVLDEIQMIADPTRGWSWTRVLLGLPAEQLHCCGDPAAAPVLQQLAQQCAEPLVVQRYRRLTPLVVESEPLSGLSDVQEGDCVVAFGRKALHTLRKNIMMTSEGRWVPAATGRP
jgi:ATP-dependent RNA helicase SUPV3L1/SUV3